jgi:hypothetical protein
VRVNSADNVAARRVVLRATDLYPPGIWARWGGRIVPSHPDDYRLGVPCMSYLPFYPKESDIIATGRASAAFTLGDTVVTNAVQFVKTPNMADLAWQRWSTSPFLLQCLRSAIEEHPGYSVVSVKRIAFPKVGSFVAAYRTVYVISSAAGHPGRYIKDAILLAAGRARMILWVIVNARDASAATRLDLSLARSISSRATTGTAYT